MRLHITEPCYVESDSPFTVIPISHTPPTMERQASEEVSETRLARQYPSNRKSPKRMHRTCYYCGRTFLGRGNQMYCSEVCKHAYYANGRKSMDAGNLVIKAGANGVEVEQHG